MRGVVASRACEAQATGSPLRPWTSSRSDRLPRRYLVPLSAFIQTQCKMKLATDDSKTITRVSPHVASSKGWPRPPFVCPPLHRLELRVVSFFHQSLADEMQKVDKGQVFHASQLPVTRVVVIHLGARSSFGRDCFSSGGGGGCGQPGTRLRDSAPQLEASRKVHLQAEH